MTAASATPQQMRDRLLQAIDGQSNIHNMVTVLEVISHLEKYPITKEALEETRLGKLINDVRKKTKDEDLAKRAKKLLRNWQKLIEPGQNEVPPKGTPGTPGSANGGSHPCPADISPPTITPAGKPASELKSRNDIYNSYSPKAEKSSSRKRKGDQRDCMYLPTKISKTSAFEHIQNSTPPPTNGIGSSPEPSSNTLDANPHLLLDRGSTELDNDRHNKIPVNAVKPHPTTPGHVKPPSTSSLLRTSVMQQHIKMDEVTGSGRASHCQPRSPRCTSFSPRSAKQEMVAKRPATYAPRGTLSSPSQSSRFLDSSPPVPSPLPSPQPLIPTAQVSLADKPQSPRPRPSLLCNGPADMYQQLQQSMGAVESAQDSHSPGLASQSLCAASHELGTEAGKVDNYSMASGSEGKKRKKYRPRDYTVNLIGQSTEDSTKPVRLKDRRLTFDHVTQQIKPLTPKESYQGEEPHGRSSPDPPRTDLLKQKPAAALPSPFQQTNWKELSRNEIIQSYLSLQSNVLTSSGAQTPGAHFFMTEYLKHEEHHIKESRKTHVLVPNSSETDLPGVSREVTLEDLSRIHNERWPGVNGCYDTKDNWYDWTQCISLDPHGDESRLNILPYVCLD
ncbi:mediator of RNA polymerase II transcription subunit 26 isoform X2 [Scleropages formosus]|uniref:Mediator of RNA polymerase II transcription subunit 26 n=1 Tax=Scleropages formosus TaxID=113540 RepID=A0A8C9S4H1_SCLFO|nr:mediator of RNA polymerase II transcription subunit 26 isoform X2 [Scleropages formosus]